MLQHEGDDMFYKSKVKALVQSIVEHPLVVEEGKKQSFALSERTKTFEILFFSKFFLSFVSTS